MLFSLSAVFRGGDWGEGPGACGGGPMLMPQAFGQASGQMPAIAGGAGLFVTPAQFSTNTWGCYVMDVDQQTLCAYQYFPGERKLRLVAARNFRYDRRLGQFN